MVDGVELAADGTLEAADLGCTFGSWLDALPDCSIGDCAIVDCDPGCA